MKIQAQVVQKVSPKVKNYNNFSCVFEIANQLLANHSLYVFSAMSEQQ